MFSLLIDPYVINKVAYGEGRVVDGSAIVATKGKVDEQIERVLERPAHLCPRCLVVDKTFGIDGSC